MFDVLNQIQLEIFRRAVRVEFIDDDTLEFVCPWDGRQFVVVQYDEGADVTQVEGGIGRITGHSDALQQRLAGNVQTERGEWVPRNRAAEFVAAGA